MEDSLKPRPPCLKLDSDSGVGPSSMERGTTSSTLDSPFGSQLNTPIDEKFQNLGGILRIQSSDFAQVEAEDKDGLVKEQAATTAVESRSEDTVYEPPSESRSPSERSARTNQKSMSSATASNLFSSVVNELFSSSEPASGVEYVASCIIKVLFFLPWCALVGGTILLAPEYLEQITFCTGYTSSPPTPIHRFAHWSEYATTYVLSFVVLLGSVVWWNLPLGLLLFSGVTAQIVMTWSEFVVNLNAPLGEDDKQTLYILAEKFVFGGEASMEMKCLGSKYYAINMYSLRRKMIITICLVLAIDARLMGLRDWFVSPVTRRSPNALTDNFTERGIPSNCYFLPVHAAVECA